MIVVENSIELKRIIKQRIIEQGPNCDLNDLDVSKVKDMSWVLFGLQFNGDISKWDTSNVKDMSYMFYDSQFSGDISDWDVSNTKTKFCIFFRSPLDGGNEPEWYKK